MSITAMQEALFALEAALSDDRPYILHCEEAITALRTAIAEAEKVEPVAWYDEEMDCAYTASELDGGTADGLAPLFLAAGAQPAPKQEFIQPGYQLVPVEPTDKMVQASLHLDLSYMPLQEGYDRAAVYKAMLAAAPVQAQPAPKQEPVATFDVAVNERVAAINYDCAKHKLPSGTPLYLAAGAQERKPLTKNGEKS